MSDTQLWLEEQRCLAIMRQFDATIQYQPHIPDFWSDEIALLNSWTHSESSNNNSDAANLGYDLSNFSPAIPSDSESHVLPVPTDIDNVLSSLFLLSNSADHATLQGTPSLPEFAAHVLEDHSLPVSDWNFPDLSPLMPRATDLPATADLESLQLISQDQLSPMSVSTASNEAHSNTNFINFSLGGCQKNNMKDRRSLATIVRAECRRLCGAVQYGEINARKNTYSITRRKYTLPDPDDTPRHDANGMRLHNPQWGRPVTDRINERFIDAVIDAVQLVPAESTVGCERQAIHRLVKTYFRHLSHHYAKQVSA